ncbi:MULTISPECIES: hypothetical protein [unclassified Rhizobium]|uniref:hypothetical protein n=1 Tax=unclassified Rhizobium TaxID=2613769 RepID=UPI001FEE9149|nr:MULTISPECIES: hypothetical protein [unclassified Rhizobium]
MIVAAALQTVSVSTVHAADDPFGKFPIVIQCKYKTTVHAFYLSRVTEDGLATYVASDSIAGTISLDGHAKAVGGKGGGSCVGKTLEELRASGQAHDLGKL